MIILIDLLAALGEQVIDLIECVLADLFALGADDDEQILRAGCLRFPCQEITLCQNALIRLSPHHRARVQHAGKSRQLTLELHPHGGHVGFVSGTVPWRARYWLEQRIPDFLQDYLDASRA